MLWRPARYPVHPDDARWRLPWRGLFAAGLGVALGTAAQLQQPQLWGREVYGAILAIVSVSYGFFALKRRAIDGFWVLQATALTLAAGLAFSLAGWRACGLDAQRLPTHLEGRDLQLTGVIADMPQRLDNGWRFRFEVDRADWQGQPVAVPPVVWLSWYGPWPGASPSAAQPPAVQAGERWRVTARLKQALGAVNPHGFDLELWLWEQGVLATGYVRTGPRDAAPERLAAPGGSHPVEQARQRVRDAIARQLAADAPGDAATRMAAGVVVALVTGDQRAIDRADWDVFRATGVAHLMSISGLHITMLAWLAGALAAWVWRQSARAPAGSWLARGCLVCPAPAVGQLAGLAVAVAYALFCGWGVPAQRTVTMLAVVTLLGLSGKRWPASMVWLGTLALVLLIDPWAALQAGFWLSFVAVGILFATNLRAENDVPTLTSGPQGADSSLPASGRGRGLWRPLVGMLREQWVLTLALTPLSLVLFGQVSVVGLVANLLAIPWVTAVVTPLSLLGVLWAPLWSLAAQAVAVLAAVLEPLSRWPWAVWTAPAAAPGWAALLGVLGGIGLVGRWPPAVRWLAWPLFLPVLLWSSPRPQPGTFELLAADVGQGNAVVVRTAGHALVYDAGPRFSRDSDAGHRVLVPLLRSLGVRLDRVVLSHRDADHTGGAAAVLASQPQAEVWSSLEPGHPLRDLAPHHRCEAGQSWVWDGVRFEFLFPDAAELDRVERLPPPDAPEASRRSRDRPNARSCVLRIEDPAGAVALLVGDIEAPQEQALVSAGAPLRADVLLVPHHGSNTSSTPGFVQAVGPRWAWVQSGYRNRYGHPTAQVVARYRAQGTRVLASPSCGAMHWRSAQPDQARCERDLNPRYWRSRPDRPVSVQEDVT